MDVRAVKDKPLETLGPFLADFAENPLNECVSFDPVVSPGCTNDIEGGGANCPLDSGGVANAAQKSVELLEALCYQASPSESKNSNLVDFVVLNNSLFEGVPHDPLFGASPIVRGVEFGFEKDCKGIPFSASRRPPLETSVLLSLVDSVGALSEADRDSGGQILNTVDSESGGDAESSLVCPGSPIVSSKKNSALKFPVVKAIKRDYYKSRTFFDPAVRDEIRKNLWNNLHALEYEFSIEKSIGVCVMKPKRPSGYV